MRHLAARGGPSGELGLNNHNGADLYTLLYSLPEALPRGVLTPHWVKQSSGYSYHLKTKTHRELYPTTPVVTL